MKFVYFLLLTFLSIQVVAQTNQNRFAFSENNEVSVYQNGSSLKNPWAGGINYGEVGTMDLNNDGRQDLVVFDKLGSRVTTYIDINDNGAPEYQYAPEYRNAFPFASDWMLLRDYNCDGKKDVFCGVRGGIVVYTNTSIGANLSFQKAHSEVKLQVQISAGVVNLHVPITDVPGIIDMDNDGDLDILTWGGSVSYVELMENKQACGLNFERKESCWGHFLEDAFTNQVILDTCTPFKNKTNKTMHAGGTLLPIDLNGDGVKEVLISDVSYKNMIALYNTGSADSAFISSQDTVYPSTHPIDVNLFPAAFYEDVDGDGVKDLVVSPNQTGFTGAENFKSMHLYKNTGTNSIPNFQFVEKRFLQKDQIDIGEGCVPRFVDLNGDSLQDMVLANSSYFSGNGNHLSTFSYYENTGTSTQPEFTLIDSNFINIGSYSLGAMSIPAFGDLDGDSDNDLIVGDQNGQLHFFTNTGSSLNPSFSLTTAGIGGIDVGNAAAPFLFDVDSNGTLDLLIGNSLGKVFYYDNASSSAPSFNLINSFFGGIDVSTPFIDGYSVPYMFRNNGVVNLMVGSGNGVYQFDSINQVVSRPALIQKTIGNDSMTNASFNETPFGLSKYIGRNQFLITATELRDLGFIQGFITRISFEVTSSGHNIVQKGVNVFMKNTSVTDLTAFETGLTQVNEDERILPGAGIQLDEPFLWDGTSNLVVEMCFSGNVFVQSNGTVKMSPTSFNSSAWGDVAGFNNINANGCNIPYLASAMKRPNIRLQITPAFVNTDVFLRDGHRNAGAFADLNNDGFIDGVVGNFSGGAAYYKGELYDIGLEENPEFTSGDLAVYPNPGNGRYSISTENLGNTAILSIYDLRGKLVQSVEVSEETTIVNIEKQGKGLYLFILRDGGKTYSQKVIKE